MMVRFRPTILRQYLLQGQLPTTGCLRSQARLPCIAARNRGAYLLSYAPVRAIHSESTPTASNGPADPAFVPLRKLLKDEAKKQKLSGKKKKKNANNQVVEGWELTVGIEIHAQLNTAKKLFSGATTSFNDHPNTHVAYFDLAIPGSQPVFQKETLIPALRAALALNCDIQQVSTFDRKHYFHWDQPSGYQITQYYEPFARNGVITLQARDGIAVEDGEGISVGIKQIQMEQDTAKTLAQLDNVHWVDFNRVGVPLIEIITLPEIHHPATAAALVKKVQVLLRAVDACVSGMEAGGLRADVNVSVRRSDDPSAPLGQRTEIKNLSSFKAVEDAIIAERDRQIAVLESGGTIASETRGWSIGSTETRRLRGKEGEVDYRYMPDPDLAPIVIGEDLVQHLRETMGELPDAEVDGLIEDFKLTPKDARSLVGLNSGMGVEYFWNVVDALKHRLGSSSLADNLPCYQLAANWILHEFGKLWFDEHEDDAARDFGFTEDGQCARVPVDHLADILFFLYRSQITSRIAKEILWAVFRGRVPAEYASVRDVIDTEDLWFRELSDAEYAALADEAVKGQESVVRVFMEKQEKYPQGKLMFLVGRMMRLGPEERIDPRSAERVMRERIEERYIPRLRGE
ncbi:GatB/GatE catalytic domain-containing protein [Camillea tinctor]|nr:GatB/GatE catalytic domain-containing protein [Camillea tinctor]